MTVLGVVQARMSSTRLPGKVLKPLLGMPMILRQLERLSQCREVQRWVVATSEEPTDDALVDILHAAEVCVFRGPLADVLSRFYQVSVHYPCQHIVRVTADCPLIDAALVDQVVALQVQCQNDYTSNVTPPTFPDGLDVEVLSRATLQHIWAVAKSPPEREHVTLYIRQHLAAFTIGCVRSPEDRSAMRWTVDEAADFTFVQSVYERLYPHNPVFTTADILHLLAPETVKDR